MAEKKSTKKSKSLENMSLAEARLELQKTILAVRSGEEKDTSKIKKLKKHIARLLTIENQNK
ncbi:MAG: hypothetical protein Kow0081_2780 [Candidatus Dojkabacteria bacterium]